LSPESRKNNKHGRASVQSSNLLSTATKKKNISIINSKMYNASDRPRDEHMIALKGKLN